MSATTGTDTNDGLTASSPVATLARGIALLGTTARQTIGLVSGQYSHQLRFMAGTVRLVGIGDDGRRLCNPMDFPRITSPTPTGLEVTGGSITVEQVHLVAAQGTAGQPSSTGAFVSGGTVLLTDVTLESSEAAAGTTPSMALPPGASSCNGLADCADGGTGLTGTSGAPSDGGAFGAMGFIPGAGARGSAGGRGFNGTASVAETYGNCIDRCSGAAPCISNDLFCGAIGGRAVTATRGLCGCGGTGASPGEPGGGGGASIGLLVTGSGSVTMTRGRLQAGRGGNGAAGGAPSMPLPGGSGTPGSSASCIDFVGGSCSRSLCVAQCSPLGPTRTVTATPGGRGGTGGRGGIGGGGAGGPSIGWVRVGASAMVTVSPLTTVMPGTGGLGVDGARDGLSATQLVWP